MMRLRRASVIAALSLLASAATAYAECAWVLWMQITPTGGGPDKLAAMTAYQNKGGCEQARTQAQQVARDAERKVGVPEPHLFCLPDTVDPREPKAK